MILTYRPLYDHVWPGTLISEFQRDANRFRANWAGTLYNLERELQHLGAREPVLQVAVSDRDVRIDGELRADARIQHSAVILSFEKPGQGRLRYPAQRWTQAVPMHTYPLPGWQANVRAIALTLEALRLVSRHGVSADGQQYAGFRELGAGVAAGPAGSSTMTVEEAARFLLEHGAFPGDQMTTAGVIGNGEVIDHLYRRAAKRLHPDAGGSAEDFRRLTAANELLTKATQ